MLIMIMIDYYDDNVDQDNGDYNQITVKCSKGNWLISMNETELNDFTWWWF